LGVCASTVVIVLSLFLIPFQSALASVNLPLHHWAYEAIERLTALDIIDHAMVIPKPYSRKQAAKYVARALERIRSNEIHADGREASAEPLLERLMAELRQELLDIGAVTRKRSEQASSSLRYGARLQTEIDAFAIGGHQEVR